MANAREHIEEIRKERFWIGVGKNPLSKTLRMAVKYLSAELYSKDVHFLMELIQNAEDNEYPEGVDPSLEFIVTSRDITATGAPATLLIFNNEKGFSRKNMESICNVGDSTKAGNRKQGYIGEKGIGFKSVFLLTSQPCIFSNGYQIRFSETPCPECDIAYIVPQWVESKPSLSDIQKIYGQNKTLPTTTIILPLKPDKVQAVKEQLSSLHPELLLFLSKIKRISVKEDNVDPTRNTVRAIQISSERNFVAKKNIDAESYTLHLTTEDEECSYYMWRQRFPVKQECRVEKRVDIEEWAMVLAFPFGKRLDRGMTSAGIYSYLPTETTTNLPFVIQADFLLPSSRETILWDDKWNQGILDCVPDAFVSAFIALVRTREDAPVSSLAPMFAFLPLNKSCHPKLNVVRERIRQKVLQENIVPSESPLKKQKLFHKPGEVARLMPSFWNIVIKAKKSEGAKLHNLSSQGKHILNSSFDLDEYNNVLKFLGIEFVDYEWYPNCIRSCNLVLGGGEDVYEELLQFIATHWISHFDRTSMRSIPLLKYVGPSGNISLFSIKDATDQSITLCSSKEAKNISWLIEWSMEFRCAAQLYFLPRLTQELCLRVNALYVWLRDCVHVKTLSVYEYASLVHKSLSNNRAMVLAFTSFLFLSFSDGFLSGPEVRKLCKEMPILNAYGTVTMKRKGLLVPANRSKWVELMGSNPWGPDGYVELSDEYLSAGQYAGRCLPGKALISFLQNCAGASDIPEICPPDASFPTVSGPLTKQNALLLLEWIRSLKSRGLGIPSKFLSCVKNGSWLKVTIGGCPGYKPPSQSFLPSSSWECLLQNGSNMIDIPLVDQGFYDNKIGLYEEELKAVGVMSESKQACGFIAEHLMYLAENSRLTNSKVLAMLNFIKFLREKYLPVKEFVNGVKNVRWARTSCGERSPDGSVLYEKSWEAASSIAQIPFLDLGYYGSDDDVLKYKPELELLGVKVGFNENYQYVIDHLKPSSSLNCLTIEGLIFSLKCIRSSGSSDRIISSLKKAKCLRTNIGYCSPSECFLYDPEWGCIFDIFDGFPFIDGSFYGNEIYKYKDELRKLGVVADFGLAIEAFSNRFRQQASSSSITTENVLLFLASYRKLKKSRSLPAKLESCIQEVKWLRTRLGDHRSPSECILFGPDWQDISLVTLLPFLDDSERCYGKEVHDYKEELKSMGVVLDSKLGADLVLSCVFFPKDPEDIISSSVTALLQCIRNSEANSSPSLEKIQKETWVKTTLGYKSPRECLLFDSTEKEYSLQPEDGPFIDEEHYEPIIRSYKKELATVGVVVDMSSSDASSLLAGNIKFHSEFARIQRIYHFLRENAWEPKDDAHKMIWVPSSSDDGIWVGPLECVIHDDHSLFSSRLHVLDQTNYDRKLLMFFSGAFGVRRTPSTDDFCRLWKEWEAMRTVISHEECCAFWGHVLRSWNKKTEEALLQSVTKIPALGILSGDIELVNKHDVFLPNDLLLTDLFLKSSEYPLFVWCPLKKSPLVSRSMLLDTYLRIGVRNISESVSLSSELSVLKCKNLKQVSTKDVFIVKGLATLILGYLADPKLNCEVHKRHQTVKTLLSVRAFETSEPITMSYSLKMSSGNVVNVSTSQMVRWERESSEFFAQKLDRAGRPGILVEYATKFADAVAQGLLWEKEDQISGLSELIKFGFLVDFEEDEVAYLMKSKNMQIFFEDEEFLATSSSSL